MHLEALEEEFEGAHDETIPALAEEFQNLGMYTSNRILALCTDELLGLAPDEGDNDDVNEAFTGVPASHDYSPYGNKTVWSTLPIYCTNQLMSET